MLARWCLLCPLGWSTHWPFRLFSSSPCWLPLHRTKLTMMCLTHFPLPGRLDDKSSLVRKEALRLLQGMMLHNPFGPQLPVDRFEATLVEHNAILDKCMPQQAGGDGMEQPIQVEGEAAGQQVDEGQQEAPEVKQEPGAEASAEQMEVDAEGEGGAVEGEAPAGEADGEEEQPSQNLPTRKLVVLLVVAPSVELSMACPDPLTWLIRCMLKPSFALPTCPPSVAAAQELGFAGTLEELQVCAGSCVGVRHVGMALNWHSGAARWLACPVRLPASWLAPCDNCS